MDSRSAGPVPESANASAVHPDAAILQGFEASPMGTVFQDPAGRILRANAAAARILGLSMDQLLGRKSIDPRWHAVRGDGSPFPGEAHPSMVALRTGAAVENVLMGVHNPAREAITWLHVSACPLFRAGEPEPYQVMSTFLDATELKRHEAHAHATRIRLEAALGSMTDAVCITDAQGRFIQFNEAFAQRYRIRDVPESARNDADFARRMVVLFPGGEPVPPDQFPVARALRGEMANNVEFRVRHPDSPVEWFNYSSFAPIRDGAGAIIGSVVCSRDVTQLRLAETSVRLLSTALALCPSAVVITDPEGTVEYVNAAFTDITGYAFPEVAGQNAGLLNAGANPLELEQEKSDQVASGRVWRGESRYRKKNGDLYWAHTSIAPVRDARGVTSHYVAVREDITRRKEADQLQLELQEQLRGLLADLRLAQEDERLRISREIHDDLGQLLTALKMDLGWLERRLTGPDLPPTLNPVLDRLVGTSELADGMIAAVQRIATELRPSPVDQLGLEAALRLEVRRFQERSGIPCGLPVGVPIPPLTAQAAGNVFHICREALTNVGRHARATRVDLGWRLAQDQAEFTLVDDGIGLTAADQAGKPAIGLTGMRERATLCAGTLHLEANPPHGTRVTVRVPVAAGKAGR